ncbi:MAG: DUF5644 domain-containing protein [Sulfurospirillum sp.]|nr:DUF5644 domain-containing protein [Sulfurospirillum sp.]MBL0702489.1 DUF5644 domain-containing protein [Sulfurospirillum sp.]
MECKFVLEVFRFDCKTDYLPYYKKIVLTIDTKKTVTDLLAIIKDDDKSFCYPAKKNAAIKINGKLLFTDEKLENIREFFGQKLQLDPINSKRSVKDLSINKEDFDKKFDLVDAFVKAKDKKVYKSYIREYYASPIVNMEEDFIGDGLFSFVYDMIIKYPKRRTKMLETISKKESGVWLHVDMSNKLYPFNNELERKITYLRHAILNDKSIVNDFVNLQRNLSRGV